jgi:RND family efflux transporter MFP subunit
MPWIVAGVILLLALIAWGIWAYVNQGPDSAAVSRRDIVGYVPLQGQAIAPAGGRADVMAPYQTTVARVLVAVGQKVKAGDVLLELSQPATQAAYDQARQNLKAAEDALAQTKRNEGSAVAAARQQLEKARATERAARGTAQATPPPASATGDGTEAAPPVTVQEPGADLNTATQARVAAEQAYLQAQQQYQSSLAPYSQQLASAKAAFQEAQVGRKQGMIHAPIAGTVLTMNAQPGKEIGTENDKTPVATIVDLSKVQVQTAISPEQATVVHESMPAVVTVQEAASREFQGRVALMTPDMKGRSTPQAYNVLVEFRNDEGLVKPGMKATASIKTGEVKDTLAVPSEAVTQDREGRTVVGVLRDGKWQDTVVQTGLSDGRYTAVKSGLKKGDTVRLKTGLL